MMSLSPYLPPTSSSDAGPIYALLQVIADPAAAKKALDKLEEAHKAIENATEKQQKIIADAAAEARKTQAEQEKVKAEADRTLSKATAEKGAATNALALAERRKLEAEHAEKKAAEERVEIAEREQKAVAREKELTAMKRELQLREAACEQLEEKQRKQEANLSAREKALADDIAENEKWLAGLRPPRGR